MVGMGLPEETQAMLTESLSCTVTVPFRFMVVGISVRMRAITISIGLYQAHAYTDETNNGLYCKIIASIGSGLVRQD